ncbi:MAG: DUF2993 domain-containing protein [Myxococcota bacterium]
MAKPGGGRVSRGPRRGIVVACILLAVGLVIAGLAILDRLLARVVEAQIEQQVALQVPGARGVEVELHGFPLLPGLLAQGHVEGIHVRVDAIRNGGMEAADLRVDVEGMELDLGSLLDGGSLEIDEIDSVRIEGFIAAREITEVVGRPIEIEGDRIFERGPRGRVELEADVQGSWIEFHEPGAEGLPRVFPLPSLGGMPCQPRVQPTGGRLRLWCSMRVSNERRG